jgi:hypothetical protein
VEATQWNPQQEERMDVLRLAELLREAEAHHAHFEAGAPEHHWSGWYAASISAREQGRTPEEASGDAGSHIEQELTAQNPGT